MKHLGLISLSLLAVLGVSGCSNVLTATRDNPIETNQGTRTLGSALDDPLIETRVSVNVAKANPALENDSHIVVVSYNGVVLLAGQTPRADLKTQAEQVANQVQGVRRVHNELQVLPPSSGLARSNDTWITTKIKTQMLANKDVPSSRIKIVTENGSVFLMGLVTRQEAQNAAQVAQGTAGVQRVVMLFEYLN